MKRLLIVFLSIMLVFVFTGCSNKEEKSDVKGFEDEAKKEEKIDGLLSEKELPEPFEVYKSFIKDGVLDVVYSGDNTIVIDGINNSISFINNTIKYLPKGAKYQFNGYYYKETRDDIIKGRKLAVFCEGNSGCEQGFEILVDNTDGKFNFEEKPIISILTDYKKLGVVKYCEPNEEASEPGVRLVVSGNIAEFANNDEYTNSFNEGEAE